MQSRWSLLVPSSGLSGALKAHFWQKFNFGNLPFTKKAMLRVSYEYRIHVAFIVLVGMVDIYGTIRI